MELTHSPRVFFEIAYHGKAYHGWQIQQNARSVQQTFEEALAIACRMPIATLGCGRTDTGVHARQLFVHADLPETVQADRLLHQLNSLLPSDISVYRIIPVESDAHARFDALSRSYEYHFHYGKNPFLDGVSWQLKDQIDLSAMQEAAQILLGYEDFSCFSKSNTQVFTNNCTITHANFEWMDETRFVFEIRANRFLRNMVRAIVGTLIEIGLGKKPIEHMHEVIQSKKRSWAGASVPAKGLFLTQVTYPYLTTVQR